MSETGKKVSQISVCIVAKNEETFIDTCLSDVKDYADEIIVVDTGSTDGTIDIARQYTEKIYSRPDSGSYSTYRQFSVDQASCTWVLLLNSDEKLDLSLKSKLDQLMSSDFDVFILPIVRAPLQENKEENSDQLEPRLFKKGAITWTQTRNSQPVFHTNKTARVKDGYIIHSKKTEKPGTGNINVDTEQHADVLVSHLRQLEKENSRMGTNEAMYRFLYELSMS